ncbi:MAG: cytochrome P450 [Nonomuraea sp.]|nr:cytochrome P450 [Nonomuraea sp.]
MRRDGFGPAAEVTQAREERGVVRVETPPGYLVLRYEDVRRVLSDPVLFSSALSPFPGTGEVDSEQERRLRAGQLIGFDPPEHTRLRRILTPEFTLRRMRRLEPRITEIVDSALDGLEKAGCPADLVEHFAMPVPSLVICELLGVPYDDRDGFRQRSARLLDTSLPMRERLAARQDERDYMAELVSRAQAEPREDMLGMLVREHGGDLSTDELVGIACLLLLAGHETTANMLALGTLALLRQPDELAAIRDEPGRAEPAVEELLRWLTVIQTLPPRTTTADVEIAGVAIPAGSLVICSLSAANRDRALLEDPDLLDTARGAAGHVAFGHGVHHCLGAPLARMEMRIAFPALFRRLPRLGLAVPYEQIAFRRFSSVYGVQSLPVTW